MYCAHPLLLGCCFLSLAAAPPIGARPDPSGSLPRPLPCHQQAVVTAPVLRLRVVKLVKVDTKNNLADLGTKLPDLDTFEQLRDCMMVCHPIPATDLELGS